MSTPIKREYIKAGDRIRAFYDFTAEHDLGALESSQFTYELIERPVVLPTEHGVYAHKLAKRDRIILELSDDEWRFLSEANSPASAEEVAKSWHERGLLTLLRPVAEVASEVIEAIREQGEVGISNLYEDLSVVAAKFGVTL